MLKSKNEVNNGFISRAKKQAKNTLKISKKQNGNISVSNLSQAQDFIANINGFSSWYTLQENTDEKLNLNNFKFTFVDNNEKCFSVPIFNNSQGKTFFVNSQPGGHSSYFYNTFILENFLDKKKKEMINTVLLNAGKLSSVDYVSDELRHTGVVMSCSSQDFYCNFMAFAFGRFNFTLKHRGVITSLLSVFFKTINENNTLDIPSYINDLLDFFESKDFVCNYCAGVDYKMDLFVEKNRLKEKTWKEIYEFSMKYDEIKLAKIAHNQSCASFRDLYLFNTINDLKKYGFNDNEIDNLNSKIKKYSFYYPNITSKKQMDMNDIKLLVIDCEDIIFRKSESKGNEEVSFFLSALSLSLDLSFFQNEIFTGVENNKPGILFNQILTFNQYKDLIVDCFELNESVSKMHFLQNVQSQYKRIKSSFMFFNCFYKYEDLNLSKDIEYSIKKGNWLLISKIDVNVFSLEIKKKYSRIISFEKQKYSFNL